MTNATPRTRTARLIRTAARALLVLAVLATLHAFLAGLQAMHPAAITAALLAAPVLTWLALRVPARRSS